MGGKRRKRDAEFVKKYNSRLREDMGGFGRKWGVADEYL